MGFDCIIPDHSLPFIFIFIFHHCKLTIYCFNYHIMIYIYSLNTSEGTPTYTSTLLSKEEYLRNHDMFLLSYEISTAAKNITLPKLNWTTNLYIKPYSATIHYSLGLEFLDVKNCSTIYIYS